MANKFLNVLSDKITINENKITINTSGLGLTSNTAYDIDFPNGSIKDLNNNNFRSIDLFKLSTGESSGPETTTLPSGRQIYRHQSDEASVLIFDRYGTEVHLLIPDCKYRASNLKWGTYNTNTAVPNFANKNKNVTMYIDGGTSKIDNLARLPVMTDAQVQELWPAFSTELSAKELCDIWMTYKGTKDTGSPVTTGVPAVEYARNLTIPGITGNFDIPNLYELMIMFWEQEAIDNLDKYKSDSEYQNYRLAYNSSHYRWFNNKYVWSATEYSSTGIRHVSYNGYVDNLGKNLTAMVAPVQELSF